MLSSLIEKYIWLLQELTDAGEEGMSLDEIVKEREASGPFRDLADFIKRMSDSEINKRLVGGLRYQNWVRSKHKQILYRRICHRQEADGSVAYQYFFSQQPAFARKRASRRKGPC